MRKRLLYAESPALEVLVKEADRLVATPSFHTVKAEGKTLAGFLAHPEIGRVFLKRKRASSWIAGLCDRIRGSDGARALRGANLVRHAGFNCPAPLAAIDILGEGAVRESYLLSEALEGADILSHVALGPEAGRRHGYARRKTVSDALAREVRRLHDAGLYTRDLQETNIMVGMETAGGENPGAEGRGADHMRPRFWFLDLQDFRRAHKVSWRRRMLNLVHLDRSIGRFVNRAGRLSFLYSYAGTLPDRDARRRLVREYLELRSAIDRAHRHRRERGVRPTISSATA